MPGYVGRKEDISVDIAFYIESILVHLAFLVKMLLIIGEGGVN